MNTRRKFLKKAGLGTAAITLSPWINAMGEFSGNGSFFESEKSIDLTNPSNSSVLNSMGYLNALSFGADPTGKKDSTAAIQAAIDEACKNTMVVLIPLGTYIIKETLRCYKWWVKSGGFPRQIHSIIGENRDGKRPLIKLAASAPLFDDGENPRPMIAYALYQVGTAWTSAGEGVIPVDEAALSFNPMKGPVGFTSAPPNLFDDQLRGINFDCSGHPGAIGVYFPAAQKSLMLDVDINAVGAHTGIHGVPGRNSGAANITVNGGRYGIIIDSFEAMVTMVGVRLHGQTELALIARDFAPACIVGFEIKKKSSPVIAIEKDDPNAKHWEAGTSKGTIALIDGSIEVEDGDLMIDNKTGKTVYLRNVYGRGPGSLIASGSLLAVTGSGSWFKATEYSYTDQNQPENIPPKREDNYVRVFNILDGKLSQEPQPVSDIQNNVKAPPDYVRKHLYTGLPQVSFCDSSKIINVMDAPYNAVADTRDNWQAIQSAISDAQKDGRIVFVPKGTFLISKTLELKSKTILIGIGCTRNPSQRFTVIAAHPDWQESPENSALIRTVNDAEAESFLGFMNLTTSDKITRHVHWSAGKKSTMTGLGFHGATSKDTVYFSGKGGGRHFLLEPQSPAGTVEHRHVRMDNTSEPLSWYGCNLEAGGKVAANLEMTNSRNIRIYGIKREGRSPTMIINSCYNIGIFSQGCMREGINEGAGGYIQILGKSDGILLAMTMVQFAQGIPNTEHLLIEALDGKEKVSVLWPESVSIYKRGKIDDSLMYLNP